MSGLFGRRNRSVSTQRNHGAAPNTSSPAFAAASQAFLANRQSTPNLSSSAAAAALRSMSPPPTQVGNVQTKRMVQRQASNSPRGRPRGNLQRTGSSGSMTERTFRSPSPGRPSTALGLTTLIEPVPPLPQQHANVPPLPKKSQKRATSLDVGAPARLKSPASTSAGRGQSLNRTTPRQAPPPLKVAVAATNSPQLQRVNELERTDSHNSINFSYPRASPRAMSPPLVSNGFASSSPATRAAQTVATRSTVGTAAQGARPQSPVEKRKIPVSTPAARPQSPIEQRKAATSLPKGRPQSPIQSGNASAPSSQARPQSPIESRRMPTTLKSALSNAEAQDAQYDVSRAAEQPVKKKKKKTTPAGSHLQAGSLGTNLIIDPTTTVSTSDGVSTQPNFSETEEESIIDTQDEVSARGQGSHFPRSPTSPGYSSDSDSTPEKLKRAQRASGALTKQPSVVREDWEGEQEESLPQERQEQGLSPVGSPAAVQSKKPAVVANESRKIDEPQAQSIYDSITMSAPSSTVPTHLGPASSGSAPVPAPLASHRNLLAQTDPPQIRQASLSPSRSVRIADRLTSDLTAGRKHEPMARSASPAKSALKHASPSGQGRDSSVPPSEASDVSSASADGGLKKKRSVRVSFGGEPEIVGTAAESIGAEGPNLSEQQNNLPAKRGWFGSSKSKPAPVEDTSEEGMQPRPELPSFGSVRGKNTPKTHVPLTSSIYSAVTSSSASSEASSSSPYNTLDTSVSSDHAIGALFSQDAQYKASQQAQQVQTQNEHLPLPPEVTSVEGSGYVSDEDDEDNDPTPAATQLHLSQPQDELRPSHPPMAVPELSVQPPTPAPEQEKDIGDQWRVAVPGGFPSSAEHSSQDITSHSVVTVPLQTTPAHPSGLGITKQSSQPIVPAVASPQLTLAEYVQSNNQNTDSDDESIYSDAASDPAELEGDGFGSINAIMESPIVPLPQRTRNTSIGGITGQYEQRPDVPNRTTSWDQTQAHWSVLRQGIQQPTTLTTTAESATTPVTQDSRSSELPPAASTGGETSFLATLHGAGMGSSPATVSENPSSFIATLHDSETPSPPPAVIESSPRTNRKPAAKRSVPQGPLKHSMRAQPQQPDTHGMKQSIHAAPREAEPLSMRQSMRAPPQGTETHGTRHSMRSPPQVSETQGMKKSMRHSTGQMPSHAQPQASAPPAKQPRGALQKKHIPAAAAAASAAPRMPTQPTPSKKQQQVTNDSDSESSFRKSRKSRVNNQFSMRTSMRAAPVEEAPAPPAGRGRGGIRSVSPVSRRPFSPAKPMRTSMRGSVDAGVPTLRGQPDAKRASSLMTRPKSSAMATRSLGQKSKSRYAADSDDEAEPRTQSFHSRIVDSSDEEDSRAKLAPVRGIPRRTAEGDSTDLEDSSEGEPKTRQRAQAPARIEIPPPSANLNSDAPLSPASEKRRGLFGMFKRKEKDENSKSRLGVGTIAERNAILERNRPQVEAAKGRGQDTDFDKDLENGFGKPSNLGFKSTAERDAMVAATQARLEAQRLERETQGAMSPTRQGAMSPTRAKLNRRSTPQRMMSDSWPLPEKTTDLNTTRPQTSAGPGANKRGLEGSGWATDSADTAQKQPAVLGRSGKKKRFPLLRKAFGLTD